MPIKKLLLRTTHAQKGQRLDQVLADWLPEALARPISKGQARKLVVAGAVYLNGKRVRIASKEIQANARIEAFVDVDKLVMTEGGRAKDLPFEMQARHVLFEDEWLIAVDKPPGLPTQPTLDEARDNLFAAVKKFLAKRDGQAQPYVGLHHRLDRDTSGVVLFTKATSANAGVGELFSKHLAVKTYWALTPEGAPVADAWPDSWEVKNFLGRASGAPRKGAKFTAVRSGGDFAHTDFRILERLRGALWIEAKPKTGRTHQIRVHLSEGGHPILGDASYGGNSALGAAPRLMLHAASLTFPHPISKIEISVSSPSPEDFNQCLSRLRNGGSAS